MFNELVVLLDNVTKRDKFSFIYLKKKEIFLFDSQDKTKVKRFKL